MMISRYGDMKIGMIVFANDGGLGAQTRRLAYMIKPDMIMAIDSSNFSKNKVQHFDWYNSFQGYRVAGFPNNLEIKAFLRGLTHVLVCENPLNPYLLTQAKRLGIKVFIQSNYEFCDHLDKELELPYKFLMPSYWKIKEMKERFGQARVQYLPPPILPTDFSLAREENFKHEGRHRFLHIVGTLAAKDRNGTLDLLMALRHTKSDFELLIRSQHNLPSQYIVDDRRVTYQIGNNEDIADMYRGFDAMILPRRYGGLSLTTNEALMSGLPVIMSDISPNNELLPKEWLVNAKEVDKLYTRLWITVYGVYPKLLAKKIDWLVETDLTPHKTRAFEIGYTEFSPSNLAQKYKDLWSQ